MKTKYLLVIGLMVFMFSINSLAQLKQPVVSQFIDLVENNSLTLKAYKNQVEAAKIGARTSLNPVNPQMRYTRIANGDNYNQEIELTQEVDFPTVYTNKRKGAEIEIERMEKEYKAFRQNTIADAYKAFLTYAYASEMLQLYQQRAKQSQEVQNLMISRFESGDISSVELSKAEMENALVQADLKNRLIELNTASQDLTLYIGNINSGKTLLDELIRRELTVDTSEEEYKQLKTLWINADASVINATYMAQVSDVNIGIQKGQSLPKLTLGFRQEKNNVLTMNGPSVGLSIPLWENKNTIKQAKLHKIYADSNREDMRLKAALQFEKLYQNTVDNAGLYTSLLKNLPEGKVLDDLIISLEEGYISLLEYYAQITSYYELKDQTELVNLNFKRSYIDLYKVAL